MLGDAAKNQINRNTCNTIFNAKRLIGRKYEEREVQENIQFWPFKIVKDPKSDRPQVQITYQKKEKKLFAEEISAMNLQKLKQIATDFLGKEVKDAVIAVPDYFNDLQRKAIKDAGTISGLNVLRIENETSAAAVAYGLDKKSQNEEIALIFDLGGGSFSVSILSLEDGLFEVLALNGNTHLGGEDFDNRLIEYCAEEFIKKTSLNIKKNAKALGRVRESCEKAKRELSYATQATVDIDALMDGEDLNVVITRTKFEDLCIDLFKKCIPPLENVIKDAKIRKSQINEVVLVGGSTRIPKIQQMVQEFFGKELNKSINHDEAVAYGAAVLAAKYTNVKNENIGHIVLLPALPFSLGVETVGGIMTVLIPRNSTIPIKKTQIFSTYADNQSSLLIKVYEGERQLTEYNHLLGKYILDGIPPMPRGQPKIEVTFDLDMNSILNVTAFEKSTGKNITIVITNDKERLSRDDIDRLVKEAEKFKDEDQKVKERIEAKNLYEQYCYQVKHTINDAKLKDEIEGKVDEVLNWVNDNLSASKEEYDTKVKEIEGIFNPILLKIYQSMFDKINQYENEINNLNNKLKNYENENNKLKKENIELLGKIKILENKFNHIKNMNIDSNKEQKIISLLEEIKLKDDEIKELKIKMPYILEKNEKLITIIFMSFDEVIHYSFICKNTDKFNKIENLLYEKFPEYEDSVNYFTVNTNRINKYKTLEENKIKNSDIIILNKFVN